MKLKYFTLMVFSLAAVFSACSSGSRFGTDANPDPSISERQTLYLSDIGSDQADLDGATSCSVLNQKIRSLAKAKLRQFWQSYSCLDSSIDMMSDGATASAEAGSSTGTTTTNPEFTQQNSQVAGVLEPDVVFSNGEVIAVLSDGAVSLYKAWPVADVGLIDTVNSDDLGDRVHFSKILLRDDVLLIFASNYLDSQSVAEIYRYRISAEATPEPLGKLALAGYRWDDARWNSAALISVFTGSVAPTIDYYPEYTEWYCGDYDSEEFTAGFQSALDQHIDEQESAIDQWKVEDHLPVITLSDASGSSETQAIGCGDILENDFSTGDSLRVLVSGDFLEDDIDGLQSQAILSQEESEMFLNENTLLLATGVNRYWYEILDNDDLETTTTTLHYFTIAGEILTYRESALLKGTVNNQWELNEADDLIQVMTEVYTREPTDDVWRTFNTPVDVALTTFSVANGKLAKQGELTGIIANEEVFAVRYVKDKTYLITYEIVRMKDPLFVIDVSDPTQPTIQGELEMPGFNSYLAMIDDGVLLGIGHEDASCLWDWCSTSDVKIDLFDVTNDATPSKISEDIVETQWTDGIIDHLHVHYEAETMELFVPFISDYTSTYVSGAYTYSLDQYVNLYSLGAGSVDLTEQFAVDYELVGSVLRTMTFIDPTTDERTLYIIGTDGVQTIGL